MTDKEYEALRRRILSDEPPKCSIPNCNKPVDRDSIKHKLCAFHNTKIQRMVNWGIEITVEDEDGKSFKIPPKQIDKRKRKYLD